MRALELFAGIGGLAVAARGRFEVVAAFDQDATAGEVHALNHEAKVLPLNLASIATREFERFEAPAWLVSPPCQPFTRRGKGRDIEDPRCRGLLRLIELIPELKPRRVFVENVPGFTGSRAHALLARALGEIGHEVLDVEHCPTELGAPIRRRRQFLVSSSDGLTREEARYLPRPHDDYLARAQPDRALMVPSKVRERWGASAPLPDERGVLCTITKSYGRALAGGGPVVSFEDGLRYLSPDEILRLHAFPDMFVLPPTLSLQRKWELLGNSVHVGSVAHVMTRFAA